MTSTRACADAGTFDWIIFTSANAVDHFMGRLLAKGDVRDLKGVRICTVGAATAARLGRFGIRIDLTPSEYRSEALVEVFRELGALDGVRFLLPRADIGRELLGDELRDAGAEVLEVVAYRTVIGGAEREEAEIYRMLLDRQIDAITFTSASTVRNFASILGPDQAASVTYDGCRLYRAGDRRSRAAAGYCDDGDAGAVHDSRSCRRARRALRQEVGAGQTFPDRIAGLGSGATSGDVNRAAWPLPSHSTW